ncbi:MAG TPA: hypothetical protein VFA10_18105 [Ktedonobacteraceae bacterium]|nr:hypothetical protein [Ktedonobacteraceae bacterium]
MYKITMQDIEDYLATKEDDEEVGVTCSGNHCLAAKAFLQKYPALPGVLIGYADISVFEIREERWKESKTPPEIRHLIRQFDNLHNGDIGRSITKREWLESQVSA